MDFSAVCLDGVLGMGATNNNQLKHCRSASEMDLEQTTSRDQDWRSSGKMARTESYLMRSASMLSDASHNTTSDLLEAAEQQASRLMRSDSVVSPYNKGLSGLPFGGYQYSTSNKPSAVLPVAVSNGGNGMHGMFSGARMSPFTPSQWQELEHQALIFKYMMAGVQVPPELLIPIRKNHSLNIFSSLSSPGVGSLRPNLGWSSFHLGFANNADPEPGRCRRTDGKKWRCSRDAVPEQKYCERHMNRGRHRSRKPVEGQTTNQTSSHAASTGGAANISSSATTTSLAAARSALNPTNSNTINNNSNTSSLTNLRHHSQQQQQQQQQHQIAAKHSTFAASIDASATPFQIPLNVDRYLNGMKGDIAGQIFESQSQSMNSSLFNDNAWRSRMVQPAAKTMSFETRTLVDEAPDFGLGQMNLLPMTTQRNESQQQRPAGIRHFFDDWPTTTTTRDRSSALSWSEIEHMRTAAAASTTTSASSATQLSISIPSDFSSPASPNNKLTLSPLKLSTTRSDDLLGVDMGLGVGMGLGIEPDHHRQRQQQQQNHHHQHNHHQQQHTNWIPITWESPVGGPLAEVLNSTATPSAKNSSSSSSALNLMTGDGWDCSSTSPGRGDTSPTGVLQKTFGSLSDSSTGSSPRAINIKADSAGLCENLRTAAFVTAAAQISTT